LSRGGIQGDDFALFEIALPSGVVIRMLASFDDAALARLLRPRSHLVLGSPHRAERPQARRRRRIAGGQEDASRQAPLDVGPPPAHLPRLPVFNRVPPELRICPQCGSMMTTVSHSSCLILDVIPARVFVEEWLDETIALDAIPRPNLP
jgi:hypothetical protein